MNASSSQLRIALGILGAVVLGLLLNRLVVTDKKRIERTVHEMADAAAKGDLDLLFSHISADYHDDSLSRTGLKSLATTYMDRYESADPRIQWITVIVEGSMAHVQLGVSGGNTRGGYPAWYGTSEWSAEFRKESDRAWRMTSLKPARMYGREVSNWRDVTRRFEGR
jgi:hypothetical protein